MKSTKIKQSSFGKHQKLNIHILTENRQNIPIYGIQPIQKLKTKLFIQICVCIFFRPTDLHFIPSLHQFIYEIEDGYTPDGSRIRYGFDESVFPAFSWRGYAILNYVQVMQFK